MIDNEEIIKKLSDYKKILYTVDMSHGLDFRNKKALIEEQWRLLNLFAQENERVEFILEEPLGFDFRKFDQEGTYEYMGIEEIDFRELGFNFNHQLKPYDSDMELCSTDKWDIKESSNVREVIFQGVCADLHLLKLIKSYSEFLKKINRKTNLFVVKSTIDTYDAFNHNREECLYNAFKSMEQCGVEIVDDVDALMVREKSLGLKCK